MASLKNPPQSGDLSVATRPNDPSSEQRSNVIEMIRPATGIKVCVIGGGYVGLVTATGMAQFGHSVTCVEKDLSKVTALNKGQIPIYERGLSELVQSNIERQRLHFTQEFADPIDGAQVIFIAVGTPSASTGKADLSAIEQVARTLARRINGTQVVVIKSTVPVGTARWLRQIFSEEGRKSASSPVVSNPEFLREGTAVYDFFHPDRIVIGGHSTEAVEFVVRLYQAGFPRPAPIVITNNETAEMIKYASNTFLATKVAFVNELAELCEQVRVNVTEVAQAMGLDERIGPEFLNPGPGFGGSCLPKDLKAFIEVGESQKVPLLIAKAVEESNRRQKERVITKIENLLGDLTSKKIALLGLAFKAHTHDVRESPALTIAQLLVARKALVSAYDPVAGEEARSHLPAVQICTSPYNAADQAECLVITTEWPEFQALDWVRIAGLMKQPLLLDARNLLIPETMRAFGFAYIGTGQ